MTYGMRPPATAVAADRWLAVLRIVTGLYFAKAIWRKLALPLPVVSADWIETMPKIVARQAAENPFPWYKAFLEHTVLPHAETFAQLTAIAEVVVGVGLVLGLFTGVAALLGLWLSVNYGLAAQHLNPASFGLHYLLVALMIAFFCARAGRTLGLDAWLARTYPKKWFVRRPFA